MRLLLTPVHAEFTHPEHELARAVADEISEAGAWPTVFQICRDWNVIPALAERVAAIDFSAQRSASGPVAKPSNG